MATKFAVLIWGVLCVGVSPAWADAPSRVFVASSGMDTNDGGRATPKRTFQAAHDAVAAGGDIVVLDTAGYGAVIITKSVSIVGSPGVTAFAAPSSITGVALEVEAPNAAVTIRGITITGGAYGVFAGKVRQLVVENCVIRNLGVGVYLVPDTDASLVVRNTSLRDMIQGIQLTANAANTAISAVISDVEVTGATVGVNTQTRVYGSNAKATVSQSTISNASVAGVLAEGNSEIVVNNSILANNKMAFQAYPTQWGSGIIYTRGNNTLYNNKDANTPTRTLPPQ